MTEKITLGNGKVLRYDSFTNFLEGKMMEDEPQTLDDDMEDALDSWLGQQDVAMMVEYGDEYSAWVGTEIRRLIENNQ